MFVSVYRQNNEAKTHNIYVHLRIQTCTEPVPLKYGKHCHKVYLWIYGYFYSVSTESVTKLLHVTEFVWQWHSCLIHCYTVIGLTQSLYQSPRSPVDIQTHSSNRITLCYSNVPPWPFQQLCDLDIWPLNFIFLACIAAVVDYMGTSIGFDSWSCFPFRLWAHTQTDRQTQRCHWSPYIVARLSINSGKWCDDDDVGLSQR